MYIILLMVPKKLYLLYVKYYDLKCDLDMYLWDSHCRSRNEVIFFGLSDSFDSNHGVCVLRMMDGLDVRDELQAEGMSCSSVCVLVLYMWIIAVILFCLSHSQSGLWGRRGHRVWSAEFRRRFRWINSNRSMLLLFVLRSLSHFFDSALVDVDNTKNTVSDQIKTVFQNKQGKKTIDVYWISDDGGEIRTVIITRLQLS